MKSKKFFYIFIILAELSLPVTGIFIFFILRKPLNSIFLIKDSLLKQIIFGLISGFMLGYISSIIIDKLKFFKIIKELVITLIKEYKVNLFDIFLISLLAGICEEILFRGVLQQLIGLFLSSFIFILLHGYFNPFNLNSTIFGLFMYVLSLIIGISFENLGILCAMIFHFSYDFIVILYFKTFQAKSR